MSKLTIGQVWPAYE